MLKVVGQAGVFPVIYRGGGGLLGDSFDRENFVSGENFVTLPILVQGHQTQEGEFS